MNIRSMQFLLKPLIIIPSVCVLIVVTVAVSWIFTYRTSGNLDENFSSGLVWYPALYISPTSFVSYGELMKQLGGIYSFYENQDFSSVGLRVDFSTEDGKKRLKIREKELLNIFVEQEVMKRLVRDADMRVTKEEVNVNVERKLREFGTDEVVKEDLERLYNWDIEDFKKFVVTPALYREKAQTAFLKERKNSDPDKQAKEIINEAKKKLNEGMSFEEVAKEYSEGVTSDKGGYFGWLSLGEMAEPEVASRALSLEAGGISDVIESDLGYHIIKIHDTKKDTTGALYEMSQIFVRKMTFAQWLEDAIKEMNVRIFLEGYEWDSQEGLIVFTDEEMKAFEKEYLEESLQEGS